MPSGPLCQPSVRPKNVVAIIANADTFAKQIGPLIYDLIDSGLTPLQTAKALTTEAILRLAPQDGGRRPQSRTPCAGSCGSSGPLPPKPSLSPTLQFPPFPCRPPSRPLRPSPSGPLQAPGKAVRIKTHCDL